MALVATDWTITRQTGVTGGDIRYIGDAHNGASPSYATVIELHRWLQNLADDAVAVAASSDELDITNTLPSQRSTDNIITLINNYNIDATAAEHLYDGSIIQNGIDDIYDGIVNFGNPDVQIRIIQNGAVISTANSFWNQGGAGLNADATSGISHRFMIKTVSGGNPIDGRKLIGTCRRFNYTYSEFTINSTSRGNNVLALTDSTDLNNQKTTGTVSAWSTDYTNTEGYATIDVDNDGLTTTEDHYYSNWDISGTHVKNDFYEYMKYLSRDGSAATLYGLSGELFRGITHEVSYSSLTGTFDDGNLVSWSGASTGTGQVLADNGSNKMWIQILTGNAPAATASLSQSSPDAASATASSSTEKTISKPFSGASTGSALIGAYGLGIVAADLSSSDQLTDLEGNLQVPPNNVTNTITGLVSGEDMVLVAPWDGATTDTNGDKAITKNQMTIAGTALIADNVTTITVNDINPATQFPPTTVTGITGAGSGGYIRVTDNNGFERRLHYSTYDATANTFTIDTTDGNEDFASVNANIGNNVYLAYIDGLASSTEASFTSVHSAGTLNLVIFVRDGGGTPIKQYTAPWTQTTSSTSASAIRTSDT